MAILLLGFAVPVCAQPTALAVAFDDRTPRVNEGESLTVTVTLTPAADREVVIPITVAPFTGTGVAAETGDYTVTGLTSGNLTFASGDTSKTFVVTANEDEDLAIEDVELDFGTLPTGVTATHASNVYRALVRILDNDFIKTVEVREDLPVDREFTFISVRKDPEGREFRWWIDGPESQRSPHFTMSTE